MRTRKRIEMREADSRLRKRRRRIEKREADSRLRKRRRRIWPRRIWPRIGRSSIDSAFVPTRTAK